MDDITYGDIEQYLTLQLNMLTVRVFFLPLETDQHEFLCILMLCELHIFIYLLIFFLQISWHDSVLNSSLKKKKRSMKLPSSCIKVKEKQIGVGRMEVRFEFQREDCIHLYFAWTAILQNCVVYILQRFSWGLCKSGRVARKCKSWAARTLNFPEPTKTHWPCFCAHRYPQLVKRQWREEETPPLEKKSEKCVN